MISMCVIVIGLLIERWTGLLTWVTGPLAYWVPSDREMLMKKALAVVLTFFCSWTKTITLSGDNKICDTYIILHKTVIVNQILLLDVELLEINEIKVVKKQLS